MRALLDVNVLVALLDPAHVKHVVAHGGRLVTFDQRRQRDMVRGCRTEHLVAL